jgi:hypothetical protein
MFRTANSARKEQYNTVATFRASLEARNSFDSLSRESNAAAWFLQKAIAEVA